MDHISASLSFQHFPEFKTLVLEGFNLIASKKGSDTKPVSSGILREIFYLDTSPNQRGELVPVYIIQR
jgi:hypothetical protein